MIGYNQDFLVSKEDFQEEYSSDEEFAERQVEYLLGKIPAKQDDPKCILISTSDKLGFQEMNPMLKEVQEIVSNYNAEYKIEYHFKSALI